MQFWTVVYRTGGYANFEWRFTLGTNVLADAEQTCDNVRRAGYPAFVMDYHSALPFNGKSKLPTTFDDPRAR